MLKRKLDLGVWSSQSAMAQETNKQYSQEMSFLAGFGKRVGKCHVGSFLIS